MRGLPRVPTVRSRIERRRAMCKRAVDYVLPISDIAPALNAVVQGRAVGDGTAAGA